MDAFPYELAKRMLDAIPVLHEGIAAVFNDQLGKSFPNAPAVAEMNAFPDREIIRTAYSQGSLLVDVTADHLMAFSKTMTERVQTFAPWVCVRSVIESSALAAWLLEPEIDAHDRARRSFAFRFEGMVQQQKFLAAAGPKQADIDALNQRMDEVEADALRLGYPKLCDKNRRRTGIGMPMPSVTQLVNQVYHDEPSYRLLSAMAHGHSWAVQQLGYRVHENDPAADYVRLKQHISLISVGYLSARAVRAFALPVWYKSLQNGWDMQRLQAVLESAYDAMNIVQKERFWVPSSPASQ